jgi:hypothetical protein
LKPEEEERRSFRGGGVLINTTFVGGGDEHFPALSGIPSKDINVQSVPHRKHHVSATKPNRLMRFRETIAVYCENHTEHISTLCGEIEVLFLIFNYEVFIITSMHFNG